MFHKNELRGQQQRKKRQNEKTFQHKDFELTGLKSCKIDERTTIFIKKNESCSIQREKFISTHDIYEFLYSGLGLGGRRTKQKYHEVPKEILE